MNSKVILVAYIDILPGFEAEVKRATVIAALESRKEAGCEVFLINTRDDAPQTIVAYEVYQSREAFELHKASAHIVTFFEMLQGKVKNDKAEVVFLTELNS